MKKHTKKMIAPIVIVAILVVYFACYAIALLVVDDIPLFVKVLAVVIPVGLIGVSVFVLIERINEIRSGEEDDLSKY